MTYEEIVARAKELFSRRAGKKSLHIAVEFDITGPGEGAFYALLSDGAFDVEPYEYYDRDILVQAPADVVLAVASGEKTLVSLMDQSHAFGDRALAKAFDDAGIPVTKTRRVNPKKAAKKPEIPEEELKEALAAGEHTVQKALKKAEDTAKKTADKTVQQDKDEREAVRRSDRAGKGLCSGKRDIESRQTRDAPLIFQIKTKQKALRIPQGFCCLHFLSCPLPDTFWQRNFYALKKFSMHAKSPAQVLYLNGGFGNVPAVVRSAALLGGSPGFAGESATSKPSDARRALSLCSIFYFLEICKLWMKSSCSHF